METARLEAVTASEAGLQRCLSCGRLQKINDTRACGQCGDKVTSRRPMSLQRTWAFLFVGLIAYVPANILPMMKTSTIAGSSNDTILSGVITLMSTGSYFVAGVVFLASFCIPVLKFIVIAALALSLQFPWDMSDHTQHRLHTLIEFIGRWSMIDVFVVAVLAALLQLGAIITITAGAGINAFALSVVFTMLSASSLDSRLLWDTQLTLKKQHVEQLITT
jgi:paraquat-inducible protein A